MGEVVAVLLVVAVAVVVGGGCSLFFVNNTSGQPASLLAAQHNFLSATRSPFVAPAPSLIQECNPAEAAGSATAIASHDEYFIELHQAH